MKQIDGVEVDFRGLKLCESCWNGNHYIYDKPVDLPGDVAPKKKNPSRGAVKKSNCIGPPRATITDEQATLIRKAYSLGMKKREVAALMGVRFHIVNQVTLNQTFRHLLA